MPWLPPNHESNPILFHLITYSKCSLILDTTICIVPQLAKQKLCMKHKIYNVIVIAQAPDDEMEGTITIQYDDDNLGNVVNSLQLQNINSNPMARHMHHYGSSLT